MGILGTQTTFKFRKTFGQCTHVVQYNELHTIHLAIGIYNPLTHHKKIFIALYISADWWLVRILNVLTLIKNISKEKFCEGELYVFASERLCSFRRITRAFTVAMVLEVLVLPAGVYICDHEIYFISLFFCLKVPLFVWVNAPGVMTMKDLLQTDTCVGCADFCAAGSAFVWSITDFCYHKNIGTIWRPHQESNTSCTTPSPGVEQIRGANSPWVVAITFCTMAPNISGSSEWTLLHITILAPRIFKWLLDF